MSDTWVQRYNRAAKRGEESKQGRGGAPLAGFVEGSSTFNETATVTMHGSSRKIRVAYPFASINSWIRGMPEPGSEVLVSERVDTLEPEILTFYRRHADEKLKAFDAGNGVYRPLAEGELDFASKGLAKHYFSRRALQERHAGMVREWLDQDRLESGQKAAIHRRLLHRHANGSIGDEERFGTAYRFRSGSVANIDYIRSTRDSEQAVGAPFAREYLRVLGSGADTPATLVDIREGDVLDDAGSVINGTDTNNPLRSRRIYYTEDSQKFSSEIDNLGNYFLALPQTATTGITWRIPSGNMTGFIEKNVTWTINQGWMATTQKSMDWLPKERFNIGAAKDENALLGQQVKMMLIQWMQLFMNHHHVGNVGSPTPLSPEFRIQMQSIMDSFVTNDKILSDFIFLSKVP